MLVRSFGLGKALIWYIYRDQGGALREQRLMKAIFLLSLCLTPDTCYLIGKKKLIPLSGTLILATAATLTSTSLHSGSNSTSDHKFYRTIINGERVLK